MLLASFFSVHILECYPLEELVDASEDAAVGHGGLIPDHDADILQEIPLVGARLDVAHLRILFCIVRLPHLRWCSVGRQTVDGR